MTWGSLIMQFSCFSLLLLLFWFFGFCLFVCFFLFLSSIPFLSYSYYLFKSSNFYFINFIFHLLTFHLSLIIILLLLLLLLLFIIIITTIINIIVMLINITFTAILEKSSGGEFQARNSSGMIYPYWSREVMNKPFQTRI